jgi:hypothetical protein
VRALVVVLLQAAVFVPVAVLRALDPDEGWYAYAAERVVHGELPYRDFFFPQMRRRMAPRRALAALAVAGTMAPCALAGGSNVIRVGVDSQTIGPWRTGTTPTFAAAVAAFGPVTSCTRLKAFPAFATADWRRLGLRMVFGSYGAGGARPCRARRAVFLDNARAYGKQWQTGLGLRVGDPVSKLRRLYPRAKLRTYGRGVAPARGWWLVVRTSQVPDRHPVPALLATGRRGRVTALVVNIHAEGD